MSDEYLEENVVDFLIDDGENPLGYPPGWDYPMGDSVYVWAQTISKSCYDVFDQMITPVPVGWWRLYTCTVIGGQQYKRRGVWLLPCECGFRKGIATGER